LSCDTFVANEQYVPHHAVSDMVYRLSWNVNGYYDSQEIRCILWNSKLLTTAHHWTKSSTKPI